jgi:tetratricopeptide (TPR) repeat protein
MKVNMAEVATMGIDLCRQGSWDEGLFCLGQIKDTSALDTGVIGKIYSFSGYGLALRQNKIREGIELCERAVRVEFYEPENYLNLARTQMLAGKKRAAIRTIKNGLHIDPENTELKALHQQFGARRPNVIPFLKREHPINAYLGRLRHQILGPLPPEEVKKEVEEEAGVLTVS